MNRKTIHTSCSVPKNSRPTSARGLTTSTSTWAPSVSSEPTCHHLSTYPCQPAGERYREGVRSIALFNAEKIRHVFHSGGGRNPDEVVGAVANFLCPTVRLTIQWSPMREVKASEAKSRFSELLRMVEHGETIAITRHGKLIAHLVPAVTHERTGRQAAVERFRQRRAGWRRVKFSKEQILAARHEGHRL